MVEHKNHKRQLHELAVLKIGKAEFSPFGDVIDVREETIAPDQMGKENNRGSAYQKNPVMIPINQGRATRFHDLAKVEAAGEKPRVLINVFRSLPISFPLIIDMMERHPYGSQAFLPAGDNPFLVVVAKDEGGKPSAPQAFYCPPRVGVNYRKNVWHFPLLALFKTSDFYVVDRGGVENNLEECFYKDEAWQISRLPDFGK
ncbi:Ureidoglycolate lyase [Bartonella apihabitans]|uniref:ureidoglycolate lyase n=1 Tax=Bartonella apihabitans TaxID=2750929 RepID=UPI0039976242